MPESFIKTLYYDEFEDIHNLNCSLNKHSRRKKKNQSRLNINHMPTACDYPRCAHDNKIGCT